MSATQEKLDDHENRITVLETKQDSTDDVIKELKEITKTLERLHNDASKIIFGDEKLGITGFIETKKAIKTQLFKHEQIIWKATFVIVVVAYIAKESGILDTLFGK